MEIKSFEDLVNATNKALGNDFCDNFRYTRKKLNGAGRASSSGILFKLNNDNRDWAINEGGGTEIQYQLCYDKEKIRYGLGFNAQYVPFANKLSPIDYIKPFISSFLRLKSKGDSSIVSLEKEGFSILYGDESKMQSIQTNDYYLFGKVITVVNGIVKDEDFNKMIDCIRGHLFDLYVKIWEDKNKNEKEMEIIASIIDLLKSNKNLILTGAPGTGKTYLAKQIASQMILGKEYDEKTALDDEKKKMKEQCAFVQFHPNYDYTDFVEGLRPIDDLKGNISFKRQNGVFKSFCADAIEQPSAKITKSAATNMLDWCKNNFPNDPIKSIGLGKDIPFEIQDGHIYATDKKYPVSDNSIIRYLQTQVYNPQHETYAPTIGQYILDNYWGESDKSPANKKARYVFIIDEINRGEISKIFGELFFSIDPGYRGTDGRVKTQYQNLVEEDDVFYDGFYVPDNVYIIGTMNDIDRSVESMDFAFRRRFAFKEVTAKESQQMLDSDSAWGKDENGESRKPSPEILSEIKQRMDALNDAICPDRKDLNQKGIEGLSSAYHIGASYFLKLANYINDGVVDYQKLWDNHLKGLLFEYLRGMPDAEGKLETLENAFFSKQS